jgi:uncharacterized protein YegP (UPF0339 family)
VTTRSTTAAGTFRVVEADGGYRWRLHAPDGAVLVTSDTYDTPWAAMDAVQRVKAAVPGAAVDPVED